VSATLLAAATRWLKADPGREALCFRDGGAERRLSRAELAAQTEAVAGALHEQARPGDRVAIACSPGPEYAVALLGCLRAGVVAVPVALTSAGGSGAALRRIVAETEPALILTSDGAESLAARWSEAGFTAPRRLRVGEALAGSAHAPERRAALEQLAYLQYTSGSGGRPRGARITHGCLAACVDRVARRCGLGAGDATVSWLPLDHDFGLVAGLLMPLYAGARAVFIAPASFVADPATWLEAIDAERATHSGAPAFGYELCIRRSAAARVERLDLSRWRVAALAAETIRHDLLDRVCAALAPAGFRRRALLPAYGLAEATLSVTCTPAGEAARVLGVDRGALSLGTVVPSNAEDATATKLVSCGPALEEHRVAIVDPVTSTECPRDCVGEIYVAGPSVADGYWGDPEDAAGTFSARVAGAGPYLRTGDLGFVHEGQLYVAGRRKSVIIVRGVNHYAEDVERTVASVRGVRGGASAAFAVDTAGEERLAVVCEIGWDGLAATDRVSAELRAEIAAAHGVAPHAIVLVEPGSMPKTSSGKLQRWRCRDAYAAGELAVLHEWRAALHATSDDGPASSRNGYHPPDARAGRRAARRGAAHDAIAIVGMACRFPGADTPQAFRTLLRAGADAITEIPRERWDAEALYDPTPGKPGKCVTKWGAFLTDLDAFEPELFGISPREADRMDPQQRLLLEVAWEALESANLPTDRIAGSSGGVFVGISTFDALQRQSSRPAATSLARGAAPVVIGATLNRCRRPAHDIQ